MPPSKLDFRQRNLIAVSTAVRYPIEPENKRKAPRLRRGAFFIALAGADALELNILFIVSPYSTRYDAGPDALRWVVTIELHLGGTNESSANLGLYGGIDCRRFF